MKSFTQMTKNVIRHILATAYHLSGAYRTLHKGKVLILMYHRVLSQKELSQQYVQPGMYVHVNVFEKQMQFLKNNFQIIAFTDFLNLCAEGGVKQDERYCVITFDDGWLDNYLYAYPILKKNKISATIFLPTAYVGTNRWFWSDEVGFLLWCCFINDAPVARRGKVKDLMDQYLGADYFSAEAMQEKRVYIDAVIEALKVLPQRDLANFIEDFSSLMGLQLPNERLFLNWDEVRTMSQDNFTFGAHSVTHAILTRLSHDDIRVEVEEPLGVLQSQKINYTPVFCYPNGSYTEEIAQAVKTAGYSAAVSTAFGCERVPPDCSYALKRVGVHQDIGFTNALFSFHLSGLGRRTSHRNSKIGVIGEGALVKRSQC